MEQNIKFAVYAVDIQMIYTWEIYWRLDLFQGIEKLSKGRWKPNMRYKINLSNLKKKKKKKKNGIGAHKKKKCLIWKTQDL